PATSSTRLSTLSLHDALPISHYDNGIKFFSAQGEKLDDATELQIEAALEQPFRTVASEQLGKAVRTRDAVGRYVEACKNSVPRGDRKSTRLNSSHVKISYAVF